MKTVACLTAILTLAALSSVARGGSTLGPRIVEEKFDPPRSAKAGEHYVYQVLAQDPDGEELTFSLVFGPSAMRINPKTGVIDWTPTADDDSCTVTIQVVDRFGHRAIRSYGIIISH